MVFPLILQHLLDEVPGTSKSHTDLTFSSVLPTARDRLRHVVDLSSSQLGNVFSVQALGDGLTLDVNDGESSKQMVYDRVFGPVTQ